MRAQQNEALLREYHWAKAFKSLLTLNGDQGGHFGMITASDKPRTYRKLSATTFLPYLITVPFVLHSREVISFLDFR